MLRAGNCCDVSHPTADLNRKPKRHRKIKKPFPAMAGKGLIGRALRRFMLLCLCGLRQRRLLDMLARCSANDLRHCRC